MKLFKNFYKSLFHYMLIYVKKQIKYENLSLISCKQKQKVIHRFKCITFAY